MAATITSAPASTSVSTITISHNSVYTIPTTSLPAFACDDGNGIDTGTEPSAVGLAPLYNGSFNWLESCCNGAPIVAYQEGCAGYCTAQGQNVNQLYSCLQTSLSVASVAPFFMVCNGCSQSSTSGIAGVTGSLTTTAASGSSTAAQSSNAATAATSVREGIGGVGKTALAVISILVASIFAGATIL